MTDDDPGFPCRGANDLRLTDYMVVLEGQAGYAHTWGLQTCICNSLSVNQMVQYLSFLAEEAMAFFHWLFDRATHLGPVSDLMAVAMMTGMW